MVHVSSTLFAGFSFAHTADILAMQSNGLAEIKKKEEFSSITSALTEVAQISYMVWFYSGLACMSSLLAMHLLVRKIKDSGKSFGEFGVAVLAAFIVSKIFGILSETTFFAGTQFAQLSVDSNDVFDVWSIISYSLNYVLIACASYFVLSFMKNWSTVNKSAVCVGIASGMIALYVGAVVAYLARVEIEAFFQNKIEMVIM